MGRDAYETREYPRSFRGEVTYRLSRYSYGGSFINLSYISQRFNIYQFIKE